MRISDWSSDVCSSDLCPCPDPAWYIESSRVDLHFDENEGVARNGVLFFKGVPILASPYLSFPIRKERKSGLLLPTYGISTSAGMEFSLQIGRASCRERVCQYV